MAVNRFTGATNSSWGTNTNWSTNAVPTSSDGNVATFDATSPACTVNIGAVCNNLDFTGYTNTITMTNGIIVSGNITLAFGVGGGSTGTGALTGHAAGNLTSGGSTWNGTLKFDISTTFTFLDNWTVVKLQPNSGTSNPVLNGFKINITGDLDLASGSSGTSSGTTEFAMTGTGNITLPTTTGFLKNPLTINTAGTVTFGTGTLRYNTGTFTYTAGTVANVSNVDLVSILTTTFSTGGSVMTFKSLTLAGSSQTYTFNTDFYISGDLLLQASTASAIVINGSSLYISGNLTVTITTSGSYSGTTVLRMVGTGAMSWTSITTGKISNPVRINTSGTITVSTSFNIDLSKFTYTAGTVITDTTWGGGGSSGMLFIPCLQGL